MKPGYQWSFWTTGFWMALKFFSWNLSHSPKPLINFCCKFVHFSITKALSNFIFYQIFYQALTNLVPRVLSFSSLSGSRVGEAQWEWWGWPLLLLLQMSRFKCVHLAQSWCFMMSESFVEQQEQEQQCIYLCIYLVLLVAIVYGGGICRVKSLFFHIQILFKWLSMCEFCVWLVLQNSRYQWSGGHLWKKWPYHPLDGSSWRLDPSYCWLGTSSCHQRPWEESWNAVL